MSVQDLDIPLHPQHKLFADEFLVSNKVSHSARVAGYSPKSAHVSGNRLLKRPDVQQYLARRMAELTEEAENISAQVIGELKDLAFANIGDLITVDDDGQPHIDFSRATMKQLKAVSSVKSKQTKRYNDKGKHIATEKEAAFTMVDKKGSLELLGRHLGLFKTEEQRVVLDVADRLLVARRRVAALEHDDSENSEMLGGGGSGGV